MKQTKIIETNGFLIDAWAEILPKLQDAFKDGWTVPKDLTTNTIYASPVGIGALMVRLEKEGVEESNEAINQLELDLTPEEESSTIPLLDELSNLTKKKDLLDFAKENDIQVPEGVKHPTSISAYIKKTIEGVV